jgi:hypothetical protein
MLTIHIQLVMQLELRGALRPSPYTPHGVVQKHRNNVIFFFHICDRSHREDKLQEIDIVFTLKMFKNFNIAFNLAV